VKPSDGGASSDMVVAPGMGGASLAFINRILMLMSGVTLLAGAVVLTESVFVRYFLHQSTDWQDETTVFLLVASTFLSASFVQQIRGHVAIEALPEILPPRINYYRVIAVDLVSLVFCTFFAWKSWTLLLEAWADDQHTASSWGPPLWIPYATMSVGMTILSLQILVQLVGSLSRGAPR
jgi:TRAP-type C4-dicarboxylate transport system permease small subunit